MIKKEASVIIDRPIEEVFAFVSDPLTGPQWQSGLFEVRRTTPGSLGIGSQFIAVRKFLGRKLEGNIEITEFDPNRKYVMKSLTGSVPFQDTYHFESVTEGTRITNSIELYTSGFMGLAEPIIAVNLKRDMESGFTDLKTLLEKQVQMVSS